MTFKKATALSLGISLGIIGAGEATRAWMDHRMNVQRRELQKIQYELEHFEEIKAKEYQQEIESLRKKPFSEFEDYYKRTNKDSAIVDRQIKELQSKSNRTPEEEKDLEGYLGLRRLLDAKIKIFQKEWDLRKHERFKGVPKEKRQPSSRGVALAKAKPNKATGTRGNLRRNQTRGA